MKPGSSRDFPLLRLAARALLIDASERVLLFRVDGAALIERRTLWITPGGGCRPDESFEQTAIRELWEETGLRVTSPGPCVWTRRHLFEFEGWVEGGERRRAWIDEIERFYVVLVEGHAVSTSNFEAHEHAFMPEHRWWTLDEIRRSDDWFAPRRLAALLPDIIAGRYPETPFDCGV
jgi:8-oxo-dGTP pyrophosphatase MutT (NUDIX family)